MGLSRQRTGSICGILDPAEFLVYKINTYEGWQKN
jgi:hypothetical protein